MTSVDQSNSVDVWEDEGGSIATAIRPRRSIPPVSLASPAGRRQMRRMAAATIELWGSGLSLRQRRELLVGIAHGAQAIGLRGLRERIAQQWRHALAAR